MKLIVKKNTTDQTITVFIPNSSSTTGAGLTGLAYNTSGLSCYYVRPGSAAAQLSLVTQTVTGAHSDGGFVEIDATNLPGFYRLDLSDAIVATGVNSVAMMLKGAANMAPVPIEIQLDDNTSADNYGVLTNANYGLDKLVRSTTPANTLTVDSNNRALSDMAAISGDSTAADNLEAACDGTGYNVGGGQVVVASVTGAVGSVSGSVDSVTDPVTVGTNNDKSGYSLSTTPPTAVQIRQEMDSNSTQLTAIVEDTGTTIPGLIAALNNLSSAQAQSAAAAALAAYDPPTKDELDSAVSPLATAAALTAVDDYVDTEVAAIKTVTDKIDTMLVADGGVYKYTDNSLEESPVGTGGFTSADRAKLEAILADTGTDGVKVADVETGLTHAHAMQAIFAMCGELILSGTSLTAKNYAKTKARITWTLDGGNRLTPTFSWD